MKISLTLIFFHYIIVLISQPGIIWSTDIPNDFGYLSDANRAVSIDFDGYIYVLDHVMGENGNKNIWLNKLSPSGEILWGIIYDGDAELSDEGIDLVVDMNGNVFIHGLTQTKFIGGDLVFSEVRPVKSD